MAIGFIKKMFSSFLPKENIFLMKPIAIEFDTLSGRSLSGLRLCLTGEKFFTVVACHVTFNNFACIALINSGKGKAFSAGDALFFHEQALAGADQRGKVLLIGNFTHGA